MSLCSAFVLRKWMSCQSVEETESECWSEEKMAGGQWRGMMDILDWCQETIWATSDLNVTHKKFNYTDLTNQTNLGFSVLL